MARIRLIAHAERIVWYGNLVMPDGAIVSLEMRRSSPASYLSRAAPANRTITRRVGSGDGWQMAVVYRPRGRVFRASGLLNGRDALPSSPPDGAP